MGDVQFRRADIAWGNLFIIPERAGYMEFTNWYSIDEACIMLPKPGTYPNILAATRPFPPVLWGVVVLTLAVVVIVYWIISLTRHRR